MKIILAALPAVVMTASCATPAEKNRQTMDNDNINNIETIYFAGGCFWGTEHFIKQIDGVVDTEAGYANSLIPDPTYSEVCTGQTMAAEGVKVEYDTTRIDLPSLIQLYLMTIDPTSVNRQGNDWGLSIGQASTTPIPASSRRLSPKSQRKRSSTASR